MLAICEGGKSRTYEHFIAKFGAADSTLYGIDGEQVSDMVLGLRVKSDLPDPMAVLLTVTQNRFLLNSLRGEGFLNMRLTDSEAKEAVGIDPVRQLFTDCIQSGPCLLELRSGGEFFCAGHRALFLPALLKGSAFWTRVEEGLQMFGVQPKNLTAVTGFRLDMVQRPRFSAQLFPRTKSTPGTYRVPARGRGERDPLLARPRAEQRAGLGDLAGPVPGRAPARQQPARRRLRAA